MKKILEVLQYGEADIRFNTDILSERDLQQIPELAAQSAFTMVTRLWGGNERGVLAAIRALALADLAVSVNRKQMLAFYEEEAKHLAAALKEAVSAFQKEGGKVQVFGPGVAPPKTMS